MTQRQSTFLLEYSSPEESKKDTNSDATLKIISQLLSFNALPSVDRKSKKQISSIKRIKDKFKAPTEVQVVAEAQ